MKHGFVKVAAATLKIQIADPVQNGRAVCAELKKAYEKGAKIVVFPELCLTGYTCGDLFLQELLLEKAKEALFFVQEYTRGRDALVFVGLPMERDGKLYNVAAVLQDGKILGLIPKRNIPTYAEFYEGRHFTQGNAEPVDYEMGGEMVPFGCNLLFRCNNLPELVVAGEICEDLWVADAPGVSHALKGATVLVNLSASNETLGKDEYRELLVRSASTRSFCGYIYSSVGEGESTQDLVFGGHNLIAENGKILMQSKFFCGETIYSDLDVFLIRQERCKRGEFGEEPKEEYRVIEFTLQKEETVLERRIMPNPFWPAMEKRSERCLEIVSILTYGLKKQVEFHQVKNVMICGGDTADLALALLAAVHCFDKLELPRGGIYLADVSGKEERTIVKQLADSFGVCAIAEGASELLHDSRGKTLVVNAADMTQIAIGNFESDNSGVWDCYGKMPGYYVNAGVPRTLLSCVLEDYAKRCNNGRMAELYEELAGQSDMEDTLFDFFLFYGIGNGFAPGKVYRMAVYAFGGMCSKDTILKSLKLFYRNFFRGQYKRANLPGGPKVGGLALSPRGDLRMPSESCVRIWLDELSQIN